MTKHLKSEQMTFASLIPDKNNYASKSICRDHFGKEISVGDYVIGYIGIAKKENREGYVVDIIEYENGSYLKIATLTGKIIAHSEHPYDYVVKPKEN